jgi:DNA repair photolyase
MSKALKILSRPKGNAEEYGRWSVNAFKGCSNLCEYCYLKKGVWKNGLGGSTPVLKKGTDRYATDAVTEGYVEGGHAAWFFVRDEIKQHRDEIIRDGGLFMTFTSDPCLPETRWTFFAIASSCVLMRVPVILLTKRADFVDSDDYQKYFLSYMAFGADRYIAFGWTLTGHDELEPQASPYADRIKAMRSVGNDGFKTWASIEPVIDFPSSLGMIYQALNAGCQHFKIGLLTSNTHVVRKDFQFGEHHFEAYKVKDCLHFIEDVMRMTDGKATVYWKQSVRDLLGTVYTTAAVDELLNFPHFVGKDWSMFKKED